MLTWQEVAKNLACGHTARHDCPQCGLGTNTNAAIVNHNPKNYSVHCYACDYNATEWKGKLTLAERKHIHELNKQANELSKTKTIRLPKDTSYRYEDFPREARMWLFKAGLTTTAWSQYSIGYSEYYKRVVLPVYDATGTLIWYQLRAVFDGQRPKYVQPSADRSSLVYIPKPRKEFDSCTVVEDILSAIRVREAGYNAVSLLGTKITSAQATILSRYEEVTTWLDNDRAGRQGAHAVRKAVGLLTDVVNVTSEEDPKMYSNKQIKEILK